PSFDSIVQLEHELTADVGKSAAIIQQRRPGIVAIEGIAHDDATFQGWRPLLLQRYISAEKYAGVIEFHCAQTLIANFDVLVRVIADKKLKFGPLPAIAATEIQH